MYSSKLVVWMIIACVLFMFAIMFSKALKFLMKFILQSTMYTCGFFVLNSILASLNIFVGINFLTVFIVGLLGLPGFVCLYITNIIL